MSDIPPEDIDPDTGRPYPGYSSPALDTSFHDHEAAGGDPPVDLKLILRRVSKLLAALNSDGFRNSLGLIGEALKSDDPDLVLRVAGAVAIMTRHIAGAPLDDLRLYLEIER